MHPCFPTLQEIRRAWGMSGLDLLRLTAGALLMAVAFVFFWDAGNIAPGGVNGVVIVLTRYLPLPPGLLMLALNVPLLCLGYWQLGRYRFLLRTSYVVVVNNLGIDLIRVWADGIHVTQDVMLCALYGGILGGLANGLCMKSEGSVGGTVIPGRILQFRTGLPIAQAFLMTDGAIIFLVGLVFGWENALYSLLSLFLFGLASDYALEGPSVVRTVFIVTHRPAEVSGAIQQRLWVGVTSWAGQGMYSGQTTSILFCTVHRPEVHRVRQIAEEVDPLSFVVIGQGHQSRGGTLKAPPVGLPAPGMSRGEDPNSDAAGCVPHPGGSGG